MVDITTVRGQREKQQQFHLFSDVQFGPYMACVAANKSAQTDLGVPVY